MLAILLIFSGCEIIGGALLLGSSASSASSYDNCKLRVVETFEVTTVPNSQGLIRERKGEPPYQDWVLTSLQASALQPCRNAAFVEIETSHSLEGVDRHVYFAALKSGADQFCQIRWPDSEARIWFTEGTLLDMRHSFHCQS